MFERCKDHTFSKEPPSREAGRRRGLGRGVSCARLCLASRRAAALRPGNGVRPRLLWCCSGEPWPVSSAAARPRPKGRGRRLSPSPPSLVPAASQAFPDTAPAGRGAAGGVRRLGALPGMPGFRERQASGPEGPAPCSLLGSS